MKKVFFVLAILAVTSQAHAATLDMCQGGCSTNRIHTEWSADTLNNTIILSATGDKGLFFLCDMFMKFVQNGQQFELPVIQWEPNEIPRIECTGFDCCEDIAAGVSVYGIIYPPAWFDVSMEFTVYYSDLSVCVGCPAEEDPCASESALGSNHPGLAKLRALRDRLQQSTAGSLLVKAYYKASPSLVKLFQQNPSIAYQAKKALEKIISML